MRPIVTLAPLITIVAALSLSGVRQSDAGEPSLYVCNGESPQGCASSHGWTQGPGYFVYCYSSSPQQTGAYFCGGDRYGITHVAKGAGGQCGYEWYYVTCR